MPRLLVIQDFLRHGGSESHSVWLTRAMRREGIDARLLTFRPGGALAARVEKDGTPHNTLQPRDTGLDWFAPGLRSAVRVAEPDAILLMGKMANAYAPHLRTATRARLIGSVRTGFGLPWYVRRAIRATDHLVCNCEAVAASLPPFGVNTANITVIPNPPVTPILPFDAESRVKAREILGATETTIVLLCVAGFRKHKGQSSLIRAFHAARQNHPELRLVLAGDGEERRRCEILARDLGIADVVKFTGHVADPRPLYRAADLAVMASETDAMSNFLVESQLHGLPVVAWDFAGTRETFADGLSGLLTPCGDIAALGAAFGTLAADNPRRLAFADEAAKRATKIFNEASAIAAYRRIFKF